VTLWGGRFGSDPDRILWDYTVTEDHRLVVDDIRGSLAHVTMLGDVGLVTLDEVAVLRDALASLLAEAEKGSFEFLDSDEDVHSAVERRVIEMTGDVGRKLHTARSRNDQIALDVRLYMRRVGEERRQQLTRSPKPWSNWLPPTPTRWCLPTPTFSRPRPCLWVTICSPMPGWRCATGRASRTSRAAWVCRRSGRGRAGDPAFPSNRATRPVCWGSMWSSPTRWMQSAPATSSPSTSGARPGDGQSLTPVRRTGALVEQRVRLGDLRRRVHDRQFGLAAEEEPRHRRTRPGAGGGAIGSLTAMLALQKGLPLTYNRDLQDDKTHLFGPTTCWQERSRLTAMLGPATFDPPAPICVGDSSRPGRGTRRAGSPLPGSSSRGRTARLDLACGRTRSRRSHRGSGAADDRFEASDVDRVDVAASVRRRISQGGGSTESVHRQIEALRRLF
jgi:argininosuccinate lyase